MWNSWLVYSFVQIISTLIDLNPQPPVEVRRIKAGLLSNLNIGEFILADPQLFVLKDLGEGIYADVASKPRKGEEETMYKVTIKPIKDPSLNIDDMFKIFNLHVKKVWTY